MRRAPTTIRLGAALIVATMSLTACGARGDSSSGTGADAPGITDSSVAIGSSYPLSGPLAANGTAAMGGAKSYIDSVNAKGGVKMSDGKTRKIDFTYYDDGYDPARTVQNYKKLTTRDNVFALLQTFGTAPNLAIRGSANTDEVPQVFVHSGAAEFSKDQAKNPWTVGWQPTYESEGGALAQFLVNRDKKTTVAVISQNDDLGKAFVSGFEDAIKGSQVSIVGRQTYEPTDPSLDSQVSKLAGTKADVLFSAVAIPKLTAGAMAKAQQIGWSPEHLLVSLVSSTKLVVEPSGLDGSGGIYSTAFLKAADDPQWQDDAEVQAYVAQMKKSAPDADPTIPNATWGYASAATLVKALEETKDLSRQGLMDTVHGISGTVPLLLPGLELKGSTTAPALQKLNVQQFSQGAWAPVS